MLKNRINNQKKAATLAAFLWKTYFWKAYFWKNGKLFGFYNVPNAKFIIAVFIANLCVVGIKV